MTTLSQRDVEKWLRPHPIAFRRRRATWDLRIETIEGAARKLRSCWAHGGRQRTFAWWAEQMRTRTNVAEQHYVLELARSWAPVASSLTVLALRRGDEWVVYDGNHRLMALLVAAARSRSARTQVTHVGVLYRREK